MIPCLRAVNLIAPLTALVLWAGLLEASPNAHIEPIAGSDGTVACTGDPTELDFDATGSGPGVDALGFFWIHTCGGALWSDPESPTPPLLIPEDDFCAGLRCEVSVEVSNDAGEYDVATLPITVTDLDGPAVAAALVPLGSASTGPARSRCAPPARDRFRVACAAADSCHPGVMVDARLLVATTDPLEGASRIDELAVACGEVVELELVAPGSPLRLPAAVIRGEAFTLEVVGADVCGNETIATFDVSAPPVCEQPLPSGACCPLLAAADAGAE